MNSKRGAVAGGTVTIVLAIAAQCLAEPPNLDPVKGAIDDLIGAQQIAELKVRVVDADGKPITKAKVTPWALQSSQGHGWWRKEDKRADVDPQDAFTDASGLATVLYPYYRDRLERIRTTSVSLQVDHPDFAFTNDLHIDVPLETDGAYEIHLATGVPVEVRPALDGEATSLDNLFALWSDGRSWQPGSAPRKSPDGQLQIAAMPPGENSILLVKLDGGRATHFSKITDFNLAIGEARKVDVALRPGVRVRGVLSENVPRPVRTGRVKAWSLDPVKSAKERVTWWTWAPIEPDGSFTIDSWPAEEPIQLIALCEGYIATNGSAPEEVKDPRDPKTDPYGRPQVFRPNGDAQIELAMTPLSSCVVTVVDEDETPVAGVSVQSWPNVCWWNSGSQIYCHPLARGERMLRERDYHNSLDEAFPYPFEATSDAHGKATLALPAGKELLAITSEVYELPVFLGRRSVKIDVIAGETIGTTLRLQPLGTDKLGEWDKLAGVVFGCSTREGRRICALPGVSKKMDEFAERFREAKNQRDPQLLAEAYSAVADAFVGVGDQAEAAKWRQKAAEQAAKVKGAVQPPAAKKTGE